LVDAHVDEWPPLDDDRPMMNLDTVRAEADRGDVKLYGPDAFAAMHKAGRLAAEALDMLVPHVRPGVTTERLDDLVFQFAVDHGAVPATLNYKGYTRSICVSINHVVCHGAPGPKPLREGDILNIDVTLIVDGWHGDTSRMYTVGEVSRKAQRLIDITFECLARGIAAVKPGRPIGDIGLAIESYARAERCSVVEDFCGHGLGPVFHDRPNVLHYRTNHAGEDQGPGLILKPGMLFTIEPMINLGKPFVKVLPDGWTAVTRDRELSAQFEHTVGVTASGVDVFTYSPRGWHKPPYALSG
jgi:methionyl aminopeptidase